ncbi:MAG: hypothetical protein WD069_04350 [Planctomycetales bacterium]
MYREEQRQLLRREGRTRAEARETAWERMIAAFPPSHAERLPFEISLQFVRMGWPPTVPPVLDSDEYRAAWRGWCFLNGCRPCLDREPLDRAMLGKIVEAALAEVSWGIRPAEIAARRAIIVRAARDPEGFLSGTVQPAFEKIVAAIPETRPPRGDTRPLIDALAELPDLLGSVRRAGPLV